MEHLDLNIVSESIGDWGGSWTYKKLNAFEKYVRAYLTILKKHSYWKTIYFDGFAGSGDRKYDKTSELYKQLGLSLEEEQTYKGAAERVLSIEDSLGFDYYYFIDKDEKALEVLEQRLKKHYGHKTITCRASDANQQLIFLGNAMKKDKNKYASLIFLDPFGMQINWESIASLKGTRSDIWILVPTGVVVNRLLDRKGELKHIKKLESFFGLSKEEIVEQFYSKRIQNTLFGSQEITEKVKKPIEKIARLYACQLNTVWDYVTENPLVLYNNGGTPIFHLVFASNKKNAVKIASQIIDNT